MQETGNGALRRIPGKDRKMSTKVVVVGGVAGGMSCAARARRLSEASKIVVFERGPYPSFANCGLPYHIGGEIADRGKLIVQSAERLRAVHRLDVRVMTEVVSIDRARKVVVARDLGDGREYEERYDALVLSMGAAPLKPPIPGIDLPGVFSLRNIPDMDAILAWIGEHGARRAVVGGGGYIGLEVAEQLRHRGLDVAIAEAGPQIMMPLDPEMAAPIAAEIRSKGVDLHLGDPIAAFGKALPSEGAAPTVVLKSGARIPADVVIVGLGVKPETKIAREAGLEIGARGGIRVDERMQTSDPSIYAVGDVVEVRDRTTGEWSLVPLAGPANRQGRIAADNIFGIPSTYKGTLGTAVLRVFGLVAACTGANEKTLRRAGIPFEAVHLHPASHAGYYPGAHPIAMKLLFAPDSGRVLGAQAVGRDGAEKRVDVLATAIAAGMTVDDLAELELCYAPPFGSAKDPVNIAGMVAQNVRAGLSVQAQWDALPEGAVILDVRDKPEREAGRIDGSMHIPLAELRSRIGEIPRDRPVVVHCASGQRSYGAVRILRQNGFDARNLAGSWKTWTAGRASERDAAPSTRTSGG